MNSRKLIVGAVACVGLIAAALLWQSRGTNEVAQGSAKTPTPVDAASVSTSQPTSVAPATLDEPGSGGGASDSTKRNYADVIDAAETLMQCTLDGSCVADDQSDPRAGHLQAVGRLSQSLDALTQAAHTDDSAPVLELGSFARRALKFPDGHVQARAISLMGALAPDPQNVDSIVSQLDGHHDAALFELGLAELGRYAGGEGSTRIDDLLVNTLKNGAHFVAQTVAANVGKLLDARNVERFEAVSRELPAQSRTAKILRSTLAEYRLVATGG